MKKYVVAIVSGANELALGEGTTVDFAKEIAFSRLSELGRKYMSIFGHQITITEIEVS